MRVVRNQVEELLKRSIIRAAEAKRKGISTSLLNHYVKSGVLERVGRGLYLNKQKTPDVTFQWEELAYTVLSIPNGVVCYTTALILHGLSDEVARQYWIAVPHGTSIGRRAHSKIVRMRNHSLGLSKVKLGDIAIPIYNLERTLVEAFKATSPDVAIKALKQAFSSERKVKPNIKRMLQYGRKLRIGIEPYIMMVTT